MFLNLNNMNLMSTYKQNNTRTYFWEKVKEEQAAIQGGKVLI